MKIFIVQSHLGGGGAERVGSLLAIGFVEQGHEVKIITDLNVPVIYDVDKRVEVLNMVPDSKYKVIRWLGAVWNLRRLVKTYQPDVVIGIMQLSAFVSWVACMGTKTRVIMTEHNSFERPLSAPMSKMDYLCKFYLNRIYDYVTVLTQADKDYIGDRLKHVAVMPNPLLLEPVKEISQKENVILAAGRIDAWHYKGFDILIRAWGAIVNSEKRKVNSERWRLQIAGAGSEEGLNYLKQLCKENGVEGYVDFLGHVKDMAPLYKKSSVFVLSSRYEGFGLVLIEAMSQGCACVACDYKGRQREIVGADLCGTICEPDHINSLATAIWNLIENERLRKKIQCNGIIRSKCYSLDNIVGKWNLILEDITKKGN